MFLSINSVRAQDIGIVPIGPSIPGHGSPASMGLTSRPSAVPSGPGLLPVAPAGTLAPPVGFPQTTPDQMVPSTGVPSSSAEATPPKGTYTIVPAASVAPSSQVVGEEASDVEKYISGKAPQDLTFDIKQFGYQLFLAPPSSFAPVQNVPVGPGYVIGPGDEIRINVWGGLEASLNVTVDRDGSIIIPKIGTIGVTGLTFEELKQTLFKEFSKSYKDFEMNVSMGQLRSIRIYVVGNARRPGAFSISSLSTAVNALFESGGPSKVGSLRDIQVMRNGETFFHLDLYNLLLKGRKGDDQRLMPEDVIFVPPIGPIAGIAGNVKVPAIYELKGETRVSDIIKMAGGVTASAYLQRVQVERVSDHRNKIVVDLNLQQLKGKNDILLGNGDLVKVFPITQDVTNRVTLQGNVFRPGEYQWKDGMRIKDILRSSKDLKPDTLMDIARIDRLVPPDYHQEYRIFNLGKLLLEDDEKENIRLQPYDSVFVFNRWDVQTREKVRSEGALYAPGEFDFRPNMKLSDLIKLSGGFRKYAALEEGELTRVSPTPEGPKTAKIKVYPGKAMDGDPIEDIYLEMNDYLFVRSVPEWDLYKIVTLSGELRYPGRYTIEKGEKLSSVIRRAGGYTDKAYLRGATFIRESVKRSQQMQLKDLTDRLERELLANSSAEVGSSLTADAAQVAAQEAKVKAQFIQSLKSLEAKGRMVISLDHPDKFNISANDVELQEGDLLYIPAKQESIQVVGAVFSQSAFTYKQGKDYSYYINMCGGYTKNADKSSMYIVKMDGRAVRPKKTLSWSTDSNQWNVGYAQLEPGDTIVVPDRLDKVAWLRNIKDITTILANIATSAGIAFVAIR
jgi:protein involved in polysaccharide export with SLBB domain